MKGVLIIISILILIACEDKPSTGIVLSQTIENCLEQRCSYFYYAPSINQKLNENFKTRKKFVFSSRLYQVDVEKLRLEFEMDKECKSLLYSEIKIVESDFKDLEISDVISLVDQDSIDVVRFMSEMEREGGTGIVSLMQPVLFKCDSRNFIVSGIKWQQNETWFLYELVSKQLYFVGLSNKM